MTPEIKRLMRYDARAGDTAIYASFLADTLEALRDEPNHDACVADALSADYRRAVKRADQAHDALVGLVHYYAQWGIAYTPTNVYISPEAMARETEACLEADRAAFTR